MNASATAPLVRFCGCGSVFRAVEEDDLLLDVGGGMHDVLKDLLDLAELDEGGGKPVHAVAALRHALLTGPGLGIEVDEDYVRRMAAEGHDWHNPLWRDRDGGVAEW